MIPEEQHPVHRSGGQASTRQSSRTDTNFLVVLNLQSEIDRQVEHLRSQDLPHPLPDRRQSYAGSNVSDNKMSPFHAPYDDQRRGSLARTGLFRQPAPTHSAAASPRRLAPLPGSVTSPPNGPVSSFLPPPPTMGPLQSHHIDPGGLSPSSHLSRRHTSAGVRESPEWKSAQNSAEHLPLPNINRSAQHSPFTASSSGSGGAGPSSPHRQPSQVDLQLRESLGRYQIDSRNASTASDATVVQSAFSRRTSEALQDGVPASNHASGPFAQPSQHHGAAEASMFSGHSGRPVFNSSLWGTQGPSSGGSTRRSSMAHLLNPADTVERDDEDDVAPDDRKRRRL